MYIIGEKGWAWTRVMTHVSGHELFGGNFTFQTYVIEFRLNRRIGTLK